MKKYYVLFSLLFGILIIGTGIVFATSNNVRTNNKFTEKLGKKQTTWTGYSYDANDGNFNTSEKVTIKFKPTTKSTGTFSASPFNPFCYGEKIELGDLEGSNMVDCATNDLKGSYTVVENTMYITGIDGYNTGLTSLIDINEKKFSFVNTRSNPMVTTVLTRK